MADVSEPNATGASDGQDSSADQKLINIVNAAVGSHLKRVLPKIHETFSGELAGLREMLQGQKVPEASKPPTGGDSDLLRQLEELRGQVKKERETSAKERRQAREEKAYGELRSELTGKVRPEAVDTAAKLLFYADRKVRVDDQGSVSFQHGDREDYSIKDGVAEWLKSRDAALFVPPPAPQKTRPGITPARPAPQTPVTREGPMTKEERLQKSLRDLGIG